MKTNRTCGECINSKPYDEEEFPILCKKFGIATCIDDCCEEFVPKNSVAKRLETAAKKAATTGNRKDLQDYLRLRRELL